MKSSAKDGLNWLLESGIQAANGGVHGNYDSETGFESITVLATSRYIQAMLLMGDTTSPRQREQAVLAGRFLVDNAFDLTTDLFVTEFHEHGEGSRKASLDGCSAAIQALMSLWQATNDNAYRECAAGCARALQTRMSRVDGAYFSSYDVDYQSPDFGPEADADQLKLAAAFWRLAEDGGLREFDYPAEHMLRWALARHETLLPEWVEHDKLVPLIERYALFLEGLLPIAHIDSQASQALQAGLIKLENGVVEANGSSSPQALARLLRLRLYADSFGIIELDHREAARELEELEQRQLHSENPRLNGSFVPPQSSGSVVSADAESTVIATQALVMWDEVADGGFRDPWQILI